MSENKENNTGWELTDDALADVSGGLAVAQASQFAQKENSSRPRPRRLPEDQLIKGQDD